MLLLPSWNTPSATRKRRNGAPNALQTPASGRGGCAVRRGARTTASSTSTASAPGTTEIAKTRRRSSGFRRSSANATSGPSAAPSVSIPRWNPNARPRNRGSTESAIRASRGGLRSPLPTRSENRSPSTAGQDVASASAPFAIVERP